jgi:hypothetical protein
METEIVEQLKKLIFIKKDSNGTVPRSENGCFLHYTIQETVEGKDLEHSGNPEIKKEHK